jgi:hypothetical protein
MGEPKQVVDAFAAEVERNREKLRAELLAVKTMGAATIDIIGKVEHRIKTLERLHASITASLASSRR